jgi:hypothetical protein
VGKAVRKPGQQCQGPVVVNVPPLLGAWEITSWSSVTKWQVPFPLWASFPHLTWERWP